MGKLYDRVKVATATTGTGTITLGAPERSAANGDFLSFAEAGIPTGTLVSYWIQDGAAWASGEGIYTAAGNTLTRDANELRWNGAALAAGKLDLSGNAKAYISPRAVDLGSGWEQIGSPLSTASGNVWAFDPLPTTYNDIMLHIDISRNGSNVPMVRFKTNGAWGGESVFANGSSNARGPILLANYRSTMPMIVNALANSHGIIEGYPYITTLTTFTIAPIQGVSLRWGDNAAGIGGSITLMGR